MAQEHVDKFMDKLKSRPGCTYNATQLQAIRQVVETYYEAGIDFVDQLATIPNIVSFLNSAVMTYWTKGDYTAEQATQYWSDALMAMSKDPSHDVASLMCLVYRVMRGYTPQEMTAIYRETTSAWNPSVTVWELMCKVPIFY